LHSVGTRNRRIAVLSVAGAGTQIGRRLGQALMLVLVVFWVRRNNVGCRELASGSGGAAASGGCRRQVTHQGAVVAQETGAQNNQWQLVQPMVRTLIDSEMQ
jgi:hypothetical protein